MKRVVITGATGAIGTALVKNLTEHGVETLVLTREDSQRNGVIPASPLVSVKYCSLDGLKELENDTGKEYDVFYHFAWSKTFGGGRNDFYAQVDNIRYTLDAVSAAKRFGCRRFIGAGSQAEYGRVEGVLTPQTPAFPENGYGMAKLCAGEMSREHAHSLGLEHVWTRILSVYGPHDGAQTMVMSTLEKFKRGEKALFTKGEQLWDYLYSGDAAEAFRLLGERGKDGKIYVLGGGTAKPLKEYILQMAKCLDAGELVELGAVPYSEKQVMHLSADIGEFTADTGWKPKVEFAEGIRKILSSDEE